MNSDLREELRKMVDYYCNTYGADCLRTLRAMINGKLSRRTITKEQQTKMQAGRSKKTEEIK